jgi:flagellar basal body-associated protein FliL
MKSKKKRSTTILLAALIIMLVVFAAVTISVAKSTYKRNVAEEKITEPDFYSMAEFSEKTQRT